MFIFSSFSYCSQNKSAVFIKILYMGAQIYIVRKYIWVRKKHENMRADFCMSKPIKKDALEKAFVRVLNGLIGDKAQILEKLQSVTVCGR